MECPICSSKDIYYVNKENDIPKWDERKCPHCYSRFVFGGIIEWDLSRIEYLMEPEHLKNQ